MVLETYYKETYSFSLMDKTTMHTSPKISVLENMINRFDLTVIKH